MLFGEQHQGSKFKLCVQAKHISVETSISDNKLTFPLMHQIYLERNHKHAILKEGKAAIHKVYLHKTTHFSSKNKIHIASLQICFVQYYCRLSEHAEVSIRIRHLVHGVSSLIEELWYWSYQVVIELKILVTDVANVGRQYLLSTKCSSVSWQNRVRYVVVYDNVYLMMWRDDLCASRFLRMCTHLPIEWGIECWCFDSAILLEIGGIKVEMPRIN